MTAAMNAANERANEIFREEGIKVICSSSRHSSLVYYFEEMALPLKIKASTPKGTIVEMLSAYLRTLSEYCTPRVDSP